MKHCVLDLAWSIAFMNSEQPGPPHKQAYKHSITDGGGAHEAPSLAEEFSVVNDSRGRGSHFLLPFSDIAKGKLPVFQ